MSGWIRLGIAASVIWLIVVALLTAYEWFYPPWYRLFTVTNVVSAPELQKLGLDYWDALVERPSINWFNLGVISILPIGAMWLLGGLVSWVRSGFHRHAP